MKSQRLLLASLLLLALPGMSCRGGQTSSTSGSVSTPPDHRGLPDAGAGATAIRDREMDACKTLWTPLCGALASCESIVFRSEFANQDACVEAFALSCVTGSFGPASGATPENMTQCAEELDVSTCSKLADYGQGKAPASCLIPGKKPDGAACFGPAECAGGVCAKGNGNLCGACATAVTTAGGKCGDRSGCVAGLYCRDGACEPFSDKGGPCDDKALCAPLLTCASGHCADPTSAGGTCDPATPSCASDSACNATTKTCERIQLVKAGATCGVLADGGLAICDDASRCRAGKTSSDSATCVPAIALGSACTQDFLFGSGCVAPGVCIKGQCIVPSPSTCQ